MVGEIGLPKSRPAVSNATPTAPRALIRLPALMKITSGNPDVSVALIDGPIALGHPDLAIETIRMTGEGGSECRVADSPACTHGTFVAGILHAKRGSPTPGVCPGCTLLVRAIFSDATPDEAGDLPSAVPDTLAQAILEVIEAGAHVINLSVGLVGSSLQAAPALEQALREAARRGVIVVAAAGNQGLVGSSALTRNPWVVPVAACDRDGHVLAPSNLGASIGRHGLAAPGQDITSLAATGGQAKFSGTSAAVPFVSGTVALLWSLFPRASATQIRLAIVSGPARRRSVAPPLLDAWAAYHALAPTRTGGP